MFGHLLQQQQNRRTKNSPRPTNDNKSARSYYGSPRSLGGSSWDDNRNDTTQFEPHKSTTPRSARSVTSNYNLSRMSGHTDDSDDGVLNLKNSEVESYDDKMTKGALNAIMNTYENQKVTLPQKGDTTKNRPKTAGDARNNKKTKRRTTTYAGLESLPPQPPKKEVSFSFANSRKQTPSEAVQKELQNDKKNKLGVSGSVDESIEGGSALDGAQGYASDFESDTSTIPEQIGSQTGFTEDLNALTPITDPSPHESLESGELGLSFSENDTDGSTIKRYVGHFSNFIAFSILLYHEQYRIRM